MQQYTVLKKTQFVPQLCKIKLGNNLQKMPLGSVIRRLFLDRQNLFKPR